MGLFTQIQKAFGDTDDETRNINSLDPLSLQDKRRGEILAGNDPAFFFPEEIILITEANEALEQLRPFVANKTPLGLDIEQCPETGLIRLLSISPLIGDVLVLDVGQIQLNDDLLKTLNAIPFVVHDGVAVSHALGEIGLEPMLDSTRLTYHLLEAERATLEKLAKRYLRVLVGNSPDDADWYAEYLPEYVLHISARRARLTRILHEILQTEIENGDLGKIYELLRRSQKPISALNHFGPHLDREAALERARTMERDLSEKKRDIENHHQFDPDDDQDIRLWLRDRLEDFEAWPKTESGELKVGRNSLLLGLMFLDAEHQAVIRDQLIPYRRLRSVLSDLHKLLAGVDEHSGRVYGRYDLCGSPTGRLSCSDLPIQSLSAEVREFFTAGDGYKLIRGDVGQCELRVLASLAEEPTMLEPLMQGDDIHIRTAALITGKPEKDVSDEERKMAKALNFGMVNGMGPERMWEIGITDYGLNWTKEEAAEIYDTWRDCYHEVVRWQKKQEAAFKESKTATTPYGRIRYFDENDQRNEALNTPIQGGAAEAHLEAICILDDLLHESKLDARIIALVHDEIVLEVAEESVEEAAGLLERAMAEGVRRVFANAPVNDLVDVHLSDSWNG